MSRFRIADRGTLTLIHRTLVVMGSLCVLTLATCGVRGLMLRAQYGQTSSDTQASKQLVDEASQLIAKGADLVLPTPEAGLSAASAFQSALVEHARESGCVVREVGTSSDMQPYASRFKKDTPANEFGQLSFKAVLVGTPANVLSVLKALSEDHIPFEYDTLAIRRTEVAGPLTSVEATLELRVLARGGGA